MKTYVTSQGDVWDLISFKVYGDEGHIDHLIGANPKHRHTVIFPADITLNIPDAPVQSPVTMLPPWKRGEIYG